MTQITTLQNTEGKLVKQIKVLMKKRDQLDDEIEAKERIIEERRHELIAAKRNVHTAPSTSKERKSKMKRQANGIQFNIEYLKQKENESVALKLQMKKQIDALRKEKMLFQSILKKLQNSLAKQTAAAQLNEEQQKSLLQSLTSEMRTLQEYKKQSVQDKKRFGNEFKNVYDRFRSQNQPIPIEELHADEDDSDVSLNLDFDESPNKRKKQQLEKEKKAQQKGQQEEQLLQQLNHKADFYDHTLNELMKQTEANDFEKVVEKFQKYEEDSYRSFKFINELSDELERLKSINQHLLQEEQQLLERPLLLKQDPKYIESERINNKIKDILKQKQKYQEDFIEVSKILKELRISIPNMFDRIGCNQKEYLQLLGPNFGAFKDMDEDKLIKVLGVIEIRTNDILQMQNIAQNPRIKEDPVARTKLDEMQIFNNDGQLATEEQLIKLLEKQKVQDDQVAVKDRIPVVEMRDFCKKEVNDHKKVTKKTKR